MHIPPGLTPYFKAITALGILALIGDTALSTMFGFSISPIMGPILAVISLASGLLLVVALFFYRVGWKGLSNGLIAAWALCFAFNAWSNMGVSTSNRMTEVQTAGVQQANYTQKRKSTEEAEARLKLFGQQLEELNWAPVVAATSLRDQIAEVQAMAERESKRGGCGRICEGHKKKVVELQGQLGAVEKRDDLTKRIEATKAVLETARAELATTDAGISRTANQSTLYAKLISWDLANDPNSAMVTVANEGTGIATAIILAVIAAALTLVGAWPHLMEAGTYQPPVRTAQKNVDDAPATRANQVSLGDNLESLKAQLMAVMPQNQNRDVNLRVIHEPLRDRMARLGVA